MPGQFYYFLFLFPSTIFLLLHTIKKKEIYHAGRFQPPTRMLAV